jgi:hypothetical protein
MRCVIWLCPLLDIYLVGKLAVNAETSKYVLISHHQNVRQNPHLNINFAFHFAFVKMKFIIPTTQHHQVTFKLTVPVLAFT